jgi:pyruvate,water dikinase
MISNLRKASEMKGITCQILKQKIQTKSGLGLIDFVLEDIQELKKILFAPQSLAVFMAAINASHWINEK